MKMDYDNWLKNKCPEHKLVYRYKLTSDNRISIVKQCVNCDYKPSGVYKKSEIENLDYKINIGEIKEILPDTNWEEYDKYRNTKLNEEALKRREKYNDYLKSDKWYKIRQVVLERDNFLCQGCLENRATDVHHKNYNTLFNEVLFDLVSVCRSCHLKIHSK